MLPRRLGGVAGRCEQLAGAKERRRRASRNVVAEEGQGVDGNRAADRDEGSTDSRHLLVNATRLVMMYACTYGPPNSKPWGSSTTTAWGVFLGAIVVNCQWDVGRDQERRAGGGGRGGDAMACLSSMLLFEFPSTDVDDAHRTFSSWKPIVRHAFPQPS